MTLDFSNRFASISVSFCFWADLSTSYTRESAVILFCNRLIENVTENNNVSFCLFSRRSSHDFNCIGLVSQCRMVRL